MFVTTLNVLQFMQKHRGLYLIESKMGILTLSALLNTLKIPVNGYIICLSIQDTQWIIVGLILSLIMGRCFQADTSDSCKNYFLIEDLL